MGHKHPIRDLPPTGFKHTGIFPEQATNWDWASDLIKNAGTPDKSLNLFAYRRRHLRRGAAGQVCHVDAAKGMVYQARRNAALCGLETQNKIYRRRLPEIP